MVPPTQNTPHIPSRQKVQNLKNRLIYFSLPGFRGVSVYYTINFFIRGFQKGSLVTRASAIAFNFLIALLPSLIFLFTLIPFVPIPNFQSELMRFFENILPDNVFILLENTLLGVITKKSAGLLFFMFLATILFSTNGIHALINAFNVSSHKFATRTWLSQRVTSLLLVFFIFLMLSLATLIILLGRLFLTKLVEYGIIEINFTFYLISVVKWILFLSLIFFAISALYYEVPAGKKVWNFFSPGSIVATFLFVLSSFGFSFYVNHFGQYNKLYGSIGTLMVILLWLYINSISLLIGFELNASIKTANMRKGFSPEESRNN